MVRLDASLAGSGSRSYAAFSASISRLIASQTSLYFGPFTTKLSTKSSSLSGRSTSQVSLTTKPPFEGARRDTALPMSAVSCRTDHGIDWFIADRVVALHQECGRDREEARLQARAIWAGQLVRWERKWELLLAGQTLEWQVPMRLQACWSFQGGCPSRARDRFAGRPARLLFGSYTSCASTASISQTTPLGSYEMDD
jgi:hypothetical protein